VADVTIASLAVEAAPNAYTLPQAQEIILRSIRASFDGTSAAGTFVPVLQIFPPGGQVSFDYPVGLALAAGASADVSWFPKVGQGTPTPPQTFVGARVYNTAVQNILNMTASVPVYNTVAIDTIGMANLAADDAHLTCQLGGWYLLSSSLTYAPNATGRRDGLLILNGTYPNTGTILAVNEAISSGSASNTATFLNTPYLLNQGDTISMGTEQNSGGTLATFPQGQQNYLAATLIGTV
jgi:hypothetical protein